MAGETEVLGENLPQRHFVHHKSDLTHYIALTYFKLKENLTVSQLHNFLFGSPFHSGSEKGEDDRRRRLFSSIVPFP
jgi:hypothetical protein